MYKEKIDSLITEWKDELTGTLKRWISIDSVAGPAEGEGYPFGKTCRSMLDMALADARAMGFDTDVFGGYAGHVLLGDGDQTMGVLAHLDIVPAGGGWTHDPFGGEITGGRLYGRGAIDNKGPAVAALYALRAVREAGVELRHGVRLILGCAEEIGMDDMRHYAAAAPLPDYGFSPDAGFPLINIEKGGLNLELTYESRESEARVPIFSMYAGERPNVVPDTARAEVGICAVTIDELRAALNDLPGEITVSAADIEGRAVIEARGRAAHAAMPASGVNAAGMLLTALARINAGGEGINRVIKVLAEKIGMENDGKSLRIACEEALSGALTCNLGILRCDGRGVRAELDIRYPIGADESDMQAAVRDALSEAGVAVTRLQGRPVHHIPEDCRLVRELLSVYSELTGLEAYTIAIGGGTYARMIPNAVAFGCAFPGDADCAHMPDESVDIEKLLLCCRIMAHAIIRLAG